MTSAPPACLYCGGPCCAPLFDKIHDRLGHAPGEWSFLRCDNCGAGRLAPWPDLADLASFYPPVYSFSPRLGGAQGWRAWLARAEQTLFFQRIYTGTAARIARRAGVTKAQPLRLLDLGCGRGLRTVALRDAGFAAEGLDFQPEVVAALQRETGIPAVAGDAARADDVLSAGSFDVVTAFYLLEHVPDVQAVLRAAARLLRPGGLFAAAIPLVDGWQPRIFGKRWIHVGEAPRHLSLPTQAGLRAACAASGLREVAIEPDSVWEAAGAVGGSLMSGASLTHVYGQKSRFALVARGCGAVVTLLSLPACWIEGYLGRAPAHGLLFARK